MGYFFILNHLVTSRFDSFILNIVHTYCHFLTSSTLKRLCRQKVIFFSSITTEGNEETIKHLVLSFTCCITHTGKSQCFQSQCFVIGAFFF